MPFDSPSPPPAPDPAKTAAAQSAANKETAIAQAGLNMTNQVTPYGNLTYKQIGTWSDGTPRYEATTDLSPAQQNILNTNQETQGNIATIGRDQSQRIGDVLSKPLDLNLATNNEISNIQKGFLDPEWDRRAQAIESDLINRGIRPGTEAYTRAKQEFADQRSRAYNQAYLDAYGQARTTALTERNQPLNEITALMSGSQVSQPNFVSTPNTGVNSTDVIGATNAAYQGNLNTWNAANQSRNAMLGGIFGLGGAAAGGWASGGFKGF